MLDVRRTAVPLRSDGLATLAVWSVAVLVSATFIWIVLDLLRGGAVLLLVVFLKPRNWSEHSHSPADRG
jgi:hypothetical protein